MWSVKVSLYLLLSSLSFLTVLAVIYRCSIALANQASFMKFRFDSTSHESNSLIINREVKSCFLFPDSVLPLGEVITFLNSNKYESLLAYI